MSDALHSPKMWMRSVESRVSELLRFANQKARDLWRKLARGRRQSAGM